MKKFIFTWLTAAAFVSLSSCSTGNNQNVASTPATTNSGPPSLVGNPGDTITTTTRDPVPNVTTQAPP